MAVSVDPKQPLASHNPGVGVGVGVGSGVGGGGGVVGDDGDDGEGATSCFVMRQEESSSVFSMELKLKP